MKSFTHLKIYDGDSQWNDLLAHAHYVWGDAYTYYDINTLASSGNKMFVTFSSHVFVDQGFFARIYQKPDVNGNPLATFCTVTNPCKANEGHCYHDQQCSKGLKCGKQNCPVVLGYSNDTNCCYEHCNDFLDLESGILTSPNYPYDYPSNRECSWTIIAPQQQQIITIQFQDFKVGFEDLILHGHCYIVIYIFFSYFRWKEKIQNGLGKEQSLILSGYLMVIDTAGNDC